LMFIINGAVYNIHLIFLTSLDSLEPIWILQSCSLLVMRITLLRCHTEWTLFFTFLKDFKWIC
jgi:hypothetical protein